MRLLDELAMDISFAMEVRDREAELRRRERALLEERTRLAREIHDTLAQGLTGIVIQLQVADRSGNLDPTDPDSPIRLARRSGGGVPGRSATLRKSPPPKRPGEPWPDGRPATFAGTDDFARPDQE